MPVFSVKWAPALVDAVTDALLASGPALAGDLKADGCRYDELLSILGSLRDAGYVALDDTDGPYGEEGGRWSLTAAGRAQAVQELQEHRSRVSELEQCVADGLRRWDLTLDYIDPLGELLPDLDGWEHYEWRTRAAAVLAGPGVEPAPLRKRERDPEVHGPAPVYVADGADPEPAPFHFTVITVDGVKVKVTHGGQAPIWINGTSIYQPNNGPPALDPKLGESAPADAPDDGNHWSVPDGQPWPEFPATWPDPDAAWAWPEADAERSVVRTVQVLGREVARYTSTRRAPGRFRDAILRRVRR